MEENTITISKFEYDKLKATKLKYELLMQHIFYDDLTDLTYDKKDLSINANRIIKLVKLLEPTWYIQVVHKYQVEKEVEK